MVQGPSASIYQTPRCFVTYGTLGHVDPKQSSCSKRPWTTLGSLGFVQKVDLIVSQDGADVLKEKLGSCRPPPYYRIKMSLGQILEREFFSAYIKTCDGLMISQGRKAVDDMFTIESGILTMYLGKETYERAGLVGKPYGAKGDRKLRPRWVVTFDMKSPTMRHGKKGFDRLVYACNQIFNQPLTWLFHNTSNKLSTQNPLTKHSPVEVACSSTVSELIGTPDIVLRVLPATVTQEDRAALEIHATDVYEWLSLARLRSPRIKTIDDIDPWLSRYEAPESQGGHIDICVSSWQGLISSAWLHQFALRVVTALPQTAWFCVAATEVSASLSGAAKEVVLLRPGQPGDEYLMWEIQSSE